VRIVIIIVSGTRRRDKDFVDEFYARSRRIYGRGWTSCLREGGQENKKEEISKGCSEECQDVVLLLRRSESSRVLSEEVGIEEAREFDLRKEKVIEEEEGEMALLN